MSSVISSISNQFKIPESPVPNKEDMFCRNAPKLKDVPLCLFLQKMDEQEQEIQDRKCKTIQPDAFKKRVELVESELTIEKYKLHRVDHKSRCIKYGVASGVLFAAFVSGGFWVATALELASSVSIPVIGASGAGWGTLSAFSMKQELATELSTVECLNPETGKRLERLKEKCCSLAKEILSLDEGEVDSEDSNEKQILAASEFFLKNIEKYEKIYEECPKELVTTGYLLEGKKTTKNINPNTGEVSVLNEWNARGKVEGYKYSYIGNGETRVTTYFSPERHEETYKYQL